MKSFAHKIIDHCIAAVQPEHAVIRALETFPRPAGRIILVAAGKAAWSMANAAHSVLGNAVSRGIVITKYDHSQGPIGSLMIREAGHPIPDESSFSATREALALTADLSADDTVLFLLSGGGSALFEDPVIPSADLQNVTQQLLNCGADITEINTLRKRLSSVKGGRFALHCAPAQVFTVILSDVLGDPLDMIASGPSYPDATTCEDARSIVEKYHLSLPPAALIAIGQETPKSLSNITTQITGSVRQLCVSASDICAELGFRPIVLTDSLNCEAREAGAFLAAVARYHQDTTEPLAIIAGGETVVHLTGTGLGGRNQELALSAAIGISGLSNTAVFSFGSDGTDGPTDAAGGYVDQDTSRILKDLGVNIHTVLKNNDAYHALQACGGLLITGATGTNVNDLSVVLINPNTR